MDFGTSILPIGNPSTGTQYQISCSYSKKGVWHKRFPNQLGMTASTECEPCKNEVIFDKNHCVPPI